MRKLAKEQLEKMQYPGEGKALFYLGILVRAGNEKKRSLGEKVYMCLHFEPNMEKLKNEAIEVLTQHNLEEKLRWAIEGFYENYNEEIEKMSIDEKKFYLLSGTAFYGVVANGIGVAQEWMTISEASERWSLDTSTLRSACGRYKKFEEGECRKSGSTWLVTYKGMERVYGKPIKK